MRSRHPKQIVEAGHGAIADRFAVWQAGVEGSGEERFLAMLGERLPQSAAVLKLGCGARVSAVQLVAGGGRLTGANISREQIRRAAERVPEGRFIQADVR